MRAFRRAEPWPRGQQTLSPAPTPLTQVILNLNTGGAPAKRQPRPRAGGQLSMAHRPASGQREGTDSLPDRTCLHRGNPSPFGPVTVTSVISWNRLVLWAQTELSSLSSHHRAAPTKKGGSQMTEKWKGFPLLGFPSLSPFSSF